MVIAGIGRAVAALAADPDVRAKAGRVWGSWTLAKEYGFRDSDGRQPDWGGYFDRTVEGILERSGPLTPGDRFILEMRSYQVALDPDRRDQAEQVTRRLADSVANV